MNVQHDALRLLTALCKIHRLFPNKIPPNYSDLITGSCVAVAWTGVRGMADGGQGGEGEADPVAQVFVQVRRCGVHVRLPHGLLDAAAIHEDILLPRVTVVITVNLDI